MTTERLIGGINHAGLRVGRLDEAMLRWSHLLGLHGERYAEGHGLLRCTHEDYALSLRESGDPPGVEYMCYELAAGVSVDTARTALAARGVEVEPSWMPFRGDALSLQDPDRNRIVLVPRTPAEDPRPNEVKSSRRIPGWHPRKLGHVNFLTSDVKRMVEWYTEKLQFDVTDWIGDEGVWLHVNSDHHVLALLEKGFSHIHHLAFELVDWGEMRVGLDHLAQNRRPIVWGPGRHGIARNLFSYFRMAEEEVFVELFCDLEQLQSDHEPRRFPDDPRSSNIWGILPPRTYFRFDRAAIDAELDQTYAYGTEASILP